MGEFWRLPYVVQRTGLSKSEIYRRIQQGRFPAPRPYPESRMKYWLSTDVEAWQRRTTGDYLGAMLG